MTAPGPRKVSKVQTMLQLIRSLEANVRRFVRGIRQFPRHQPRLPFSLTMLDQSKGKGARHVMKVNGFTRNISETGLALLVPGIRKGDHHLAATNRRLLIVLELPNGSIRLQAKPVRYERLRSENGYLVGARIISMSDDDRVRFRRYLYRLTRGAKISSKRQLHVS
jgi:c-di-GMP-binding flagellar brake protein YcgR